MSKAREALLLAKLGKGNPSIASTPVVDDGKDFRGIKDGVKDSGPYPTAKTGSSLEVIKAAKAASVPSLSAKSGVMPSLETTDIQPAPSVKSYSPVGDYFKKKKGN